MLGGDVPGDVDRLLRRGRGGGQLEARAVGLVLDGLAGLSPELVPAELRLPREAPPREGELGMDGWEDEDGWTWDGYGWCCGIGGSQPCGAYQ